ncbi:MAG: hypothetical protein JST00_23380 [Deltaproteobacteria bacterium]|nr:hypothetical protein [Deltaproteobacteria bacterium]
MRRIAARACLATFFVLGAPSCASLRTMTAPSSDLEDYRAFRVAGAEGTRLARAKVYLERHPKGTFAEEVRAAFEEEEPRYFEKAQASREGARRYLADLPDGPHAAAALALLTALESNMQDAELRDIARRVRFEDAKLEVAAQQRKAVGEAILTALGVFLDDGVFGSTLEDAPAPLRTVMRGPRPTTWGALPSRREDDYFFLLPTRPERESRLLSLEIALEEKDGRIAAATLAAPDMFVMWAEADQITRLDPSSAEDRTEAQVHALDRIAGAVERRFPSASCPEARAGAELVHRACDGWEIVVKSGERAGARDTILVRGPSDPAKRQGQR